MAQYHPGREDLERFARGDVFAHERRKIEDHLRSGCRPCQRLIDEMLPELDEACLRLELADAEDLDWKESSADLDIAFSKLEQRLALISLERNAAPRLVADLLRHPVKERLTLVRSSRRFQTLAVCDFLVDKSFEIGFRDPVGSSELAELAIEVAGQLDGGYYGKSVVQDLKARSWAYLGNARRINSDFIGAEQAFLMAEMLAEDGSADPLEEARILDLKASLLSDQGWFEHAADLLDEVIDIYEDVKENHRKGRATISKGLFLGYAGLAEKAIQLLQDGLALIDWDREPRLVLMARHNLAWFLNDCGRCEEAFRQLERFRHSYHEFPDAWTELRLGWLQGRIAIGLSRYDEAEETLREVQQRFIDQGLGYDASMVTLDLAGLFLSQGRNEEVRELATAMIPIFVSQDVHRQAIAALAVFQQAAEADRATAGLVEEIASYLLRARKNPRLIFSESARLRSQWGPI
jgi:tetratricopeptide (TPR) repeat protein